MKTNTTFEVSNDYVALKKRKPKNINNLIISNENETFKVGGVTKIFKENESNLAHKTREAINNGILGSNIAPIQWNMFLNGLR
jgi:hypothetical protein